MGWLRSAGTAVAARGTCAAKKRDVRMMLGENQPGRGPGSLMSARFSSHSHVLQFAVTARLLLLSRSLQLPSQGSFVISSRTSSLVQRGRPGSGEEKGAWLRCGRLGAQRCRRRGGRPPSQRAGQQRLCSTAHSSRGLRGGSPGYRCVPAHVPCVLPSRRLSTATQETPQPLWLKAGTAVIPGSRHRRNPVSRTFGWLWGHAGSLQVQLHWRTRLFSSLDPSQELRLGQGTVCSRTRQTSGVRRDRVFAAAPTACQHGASPGPAKLHLQPGQRQCRHTGSYGCSRDQQAAFMGEHEKHPLLCLTTPPATPARKPIPAPCGEIPATETPSSPRNSPCRKENTLKHRKRIVRLPTERWRG